ncbi:TonB-dependent receptor [Sphingomonas naasensis]|nr:TonB-dependent receptor [Sphingomonas naasensis]NIJ20295.1 TonB-dependent receptor [Sphingomonas naasensis]
MKFTAFAAALAASTSVVAVAAPAQAGEREFSIPAGSLKTALDTFGRQSGRPLIYRAEDVRGVTTAGYRGAATPEVALKALLHGTGFGSRTGEAGAIAIVPVGNGPLGEAGGAPQTGMNDPEGEMQAAEDVVVTGFRSSVSRALDLKRREAGVVDTILAEDIGKFPDANLAESMQRVPGVALIRGDGGEGRAITVRGLGPIFTRTRINGMEANSGISGSDVQGTSGRSRGFDFNVFASEIFQNLTVRKTYSADTSDGSLGATVDLRSPRPLDYGRDFVLAGSAKVIYSDLNKDAGPRLAGLVSKQFADGTLGVLLSGAYTQRKTREEGYSPAAILPALVDGGFCSPLGYAPQNPANDPVKGTDAANCATGVPRTGSVAAYDAVVAGGGFHPRFPRYMRSDQDYERLGLTGSLQWKPSERTNISFDALYARYGMERFDEFMGALATGRGVGNNGKPHVSIVDAVVSPDKTVQYALYNGVDVSSWTTRDLYASTFKQLALTVEHAFSDWLKVDGYAGIGRTNMDEPYRVDLRLDRVNSNGFSYDFRDGGRIPVIDFGFDITNPANFSFGPALADGTVRGTYSARKVFTQFENEQYALNALIKLDPALSIRVGGEYRVNNFTSRELQRAASISSFTPTIPAGTTLADVTKLVSGFGKGLRDGLPTAWIKADHAKFAKLFDLDSNTGNFAFSGPETGTALGGNFSVDESVKGLYAQAEFNLGSALPIRGNAGIRYVSTDQTSFGYVTLPVAVNGRTYAPVTIDRTYDDWLWSVNLTGDLTRNLLLRVAASKVIARPDLGQLSPSGGFNPTIRSVSVGNAMLEPIRATTADLSAEWYFAPGSILSVGYFYKDIDTYIQTLQRLIPFTETGLPGELLQGSQATPADLFTVTNLANTKGGPIHGIEVNYQQQFRFLPGFLTNTGILLNYTHVTSDIEYILNATTGATTKRPLAGMSKNQANATLFYEDSKFSIRGSAAYRSDFIRAVPSGNTLSDIDTVEGTVYIDMSASYAIADQFKLTFEASNLTDEHQTILVDSVRQDTLYDSHFGRTFTFGISFRY